MATGASPGYSPMPNYAKKPAVIPTPAGYAPQGSGGSYTESPFTPPAPDGGVFTPGPGAQPAPFDMDWGIKHGVAEYFVDGSGHASQKHPDGTFSTVNLSDITGMTPQVAYSASGGTIRPASGSAAPSNSGGNSPTDPYAFLNQSILGGGSYANDMYSKYLQGLSSPAGGTGTYQSYG